MTGRRSDGGLFTKCALAPGGVISKYDGPLLTEAEADVSLSEYLMTAIDVQDRRRRVVIDGHPKFNNLAGFANYAAHRVANAVFEDRGKATRQRSAACRTDVVLKAWAHIAAGQEIRVDYDMGVAGRPFRAQMLERGVAAGELDGAGYAAARWADPDGLGAGAACAGIAAPARVRQSRASPGARAGASSSSSSSTGPFAQGRKRARQFAACGAGLAEW